MRDPVKAYFGLLKFRFDFYKYGLLNCMLGCLYEAACVLFSLLCSRRKYVRVMQGL